MNCLTFVKIREAKPDEHYRGISLLCYIICVGINSVDNFENLVTMH